jgi:hypothetical protein
MMSTTTALDVTERLKQFLAKERETLVDFLLLLAEVDRERWYLDLGYASAWEFVRRALGQTEAMTHYRLLAARALARYPRTAMRCSRRLKASQRPRSCS